MNRHAETLARISSQVTTLSTRRLPFRIFHGSTNSTRPRPTTSSSPVATIDISALRHILSVDPLSKTCLVEPNVPMDALVSHTILHHGLVPPVVMEFPGITAGGAFAGTAGESSSFRHGFWDDIVDEVEIVLADGKVVIANRTNEYADLFRGAAGSLGTLGITTMLKVRLVEALPFVKTTYTRSSSVASAIASVREAATPTSTPMATTNPNSNDTNTVPNPNLPDFVDGIMFSTTHSVTIQGHLVSSIPPSSPNFHKPQTFSGRWDPWFYMHAEQLSLDLPAGASVTEYVPLAEYLFRYDRGGFWVGRAGFLYFFHFPFLRLFRALLDDFLHTRMLYRALHGSGESRRFIVQDLALPYSTAADFISYVDSNLGIWPLWLCPLKQRLPPTFHPHTGVVEPDPSDGRSTRPQQMLNIGVWGRGPSSPSSFVRANRELEKKLWDLGGMKWFYAHAYYSQDEFWSMYDRPWYEALRKKYKATTLPSVYDKIKVHVDKSRDEDRGLMNRIKGIRPIGGLVGIWKSIKSKDYFLHRHAEWKSKR